jgi:hypothetical protein
MIEFGVSDILQLCREQTFRACSTKSEFSCGVDTIARPIAQSPEYCKMSDICNFNQAITNDSE